MMLAGGTIQGKVRTFAGTACCGQTFTITNSALAEDEWTIYIFDADHNVAEGAPHFYTGSVPDLFDHVERLARLWGPLLSGDGVVEDPAWTPADSLLTL